MTSNAQITTELASLHGALRQRAVVPNTSTTTALAVSGKDPIKTIDASGAGSLAAYQEIMKKNGHGRLGRTHMEDVDRLPDSARSELDIFLRRTILKMLPVSGGYSAIDADAVFAALSSFGLRLENRNPLADVTVFGDSCDKTTIERLQNFCAHFYTASTNNFASYWRASAMETLIELARYRGLFGNDGFLKAVE
ncbi:hypothetical protein Q9L58_009143 [Maublancomyces gigas]|uniref:Uncharacterized protein n=1 Tax=Discina gigas TaxID=1032678 RepID=A0ABR3G8G3_9PEZI